VDPVPEPQLLRKSGSAGNRTRTSGSVARKSDHWTTDAVSIRRHLQPNEVPTYLIMTENVPGLGRILVGLIVFGHAYLFNKMKQYITRVYIFSRFEIFFMMVRNTQNNCVFGLCPSFRILQTRKHSISETGSLFIPRWKEDKAPTPPSPEDGNRYSLRNVVFLVFRPPDDGKFQTPVILSTDLLSHNLW
jgi:hypothetical protein